jgi:uncharacterized delta-60 repeat protein
MKTQPPTSRRAHSSLSDRRRSWPEFFLRLTMACIVAGMTGVVLQTLGAELSRPGSLVQDQPDAIRGGAVFSLVRLSDGAILIGGSFTNVGGLVRSGIAKLLPNGRVDPAFAGPGIDRGSTNAVSSILPLEDGRLLIGGYFKTIHGIARPSLARLNSDGTWDSSFNAGTGPAGSVLSMASAPGGKVYVGGDFFGWDGQRASGLIRLNLDGSLDTTFTPPLLPPYGCLMCTLYINANSLISDADGSFLVGGEFIVNSFQPPVRVSGLVRLKADGSADSSFLPALGKIVPTIPGLQPKVYSVSSQLDRSLIVAGSFNRVGSVRRNWVARLAANGSLDPSFDAAQEFVPDSYFDSVNVQATALQPDGKLLVAGQFDRMDNAQRTGLARLNSNGRIDLTFDAGSGSRARALLYETNGTVLVAGDSFSFNGRPELANAHCACDRERFTLRGPHRSSRPKRILPASSKVGSDRRVMISGAAA